MSREAENPGLAADSEDGEILMDAFKLWCHNHGLKDELVANLIDDGFEDVQTLGLMTEEDISDMNIAQKGQLRLLQRAVKLAAQPVQSTEAEPLPRKENSSSENGTQQPSLLPNGLSIDSLFNQLPATAYEQTVQKEPTFTRPEFDPAYHLVAGKSSTGNTKALEIVDFIGMSGKIDSEVEQIVSEIGEGNSLVLKTGGRKLKYEAITIWQWALGAIRIQDELVRLGKLPTEENKRQYLGYCCKLLELNSRFEWSSILLYDKEYRSQQARFNFPWGTEVTHLSSVQLRDKKPVFQNKKFGGKSSNQSQSSSYNNKKSDICRDFNKEKCTHNPCMYLHQCSVDGCNKKHPATKHESSKDLN